MARLWRRPRSGPCDDPIIRDSGCQTTRASTEDEASDVTDAGRGLTAEPHGADSQFYINLYDNAALDPNQSRWGYAVFGKIVQGMEVVDKIGNVSTGKVGPIKEDAPLEQVVILKIERLETP